MPSPDALMIVGWLLGGWLPCVALGIVVGHRTRWQRGFLAFLMAFGVICPITLWFSLREAPAYAPAPPLIHTPQRLGVVDLRRVLTDHPGLVKANRELAKQATADEAEVKRLSASGNAQAAEQYSRTIRVKLGAKQRQIRDEAAAEVLALIRQRAVELKLDAVLDAPEAPTPLHTLVIEAGGLANLTEYVTQELSRRHTSSSVESAFHH